MSQKSSVPQAVSFVSQALKRDTRRRRGYSSSLVSPRSLSHCPHLRAIDWGTQSLAPFLQPARGCSAHLPF